MPDLHVFFDELGLSDLQLSKVHLPAIGTARECLELFMKLTALSNLFRGDTSSPTDWRVCARARACSSCFIFLTFDICFT